MEPKRRLPIRMLQWSLAGLCAVLLWVAGYFGGRDAGYDRGHEAGFAAGQAKGYERAKELSAIILPDRRGVFDAAFEIDRRVTAAVGSGWNQKVVNAEMDRLVAEIRTNVSPDRWTDPHSACKIEGHGTNLTIMVEADPWLVAEVGAYLRSKDDYLAWKQTEPEGP